ncbi:unnamed protein product [Clonostachys byssicola]|uniref:Uncharacterized protein n=1 Tax=Clonostachys byssicola TaxID=160290 RepID=A0A9N9U0X9_9HYPO|nr:unnamed protein product [Clonostachys byssicola]
MASSSDGPEFYLSAIEMFRRLDAQTSGRKTFCVLPWCVYCGYDFMLGDRILNHRDEGSTTWVVTSLSLTLSHKPNWKVECQPPRGEVAKGQSFCACGLRQAAACEYSGFGSHACHRACQDIVKPGMIGGQFLTMVDYYKVRRPSFRPTASESQRRRAFLEEELVSLLADCIPKLPAELLYQIAGYASSEYATTHLITQMAKHEPRNTVFDLRKNIWAEYVDFEGQTYIRALSNTNFDILDGVFKGTWKLIFSEKQYHSTQIILIEMSTLGIRRIIFTDDSSRPEIEEKPDIWWQVMSFRGGPLIVAETDGVKLRCLTFEAERFKRVSTRPSPNVMWPTPARYDHHELLSVNSQQTPTPRSHLRRQPRRMDSVDLRSPDILGLSFAIYNGRNPHNSRPIANIHAHLPGENHSFYREVEKKAPDRITWLYIPLESQELKTSKGRSYHIGSVKHDPNPQWKLVHASSQGLKRMFFEHTDDTTLDTWSLGFDRSDAVHATTRANETQSQVHPALHWAHSLHIDPGPNCSSAVLDGVIEVTQCLRIANSRRSPGIGRYTSGLLLRYHDGHVERLGEARLDLTESRKVLPTDVIRFIFQSNQVKFCLVGPPQENNDPNAANVEIPMRGTLHWCFREEEVLLRHNEQRISARNYPTFE